MKYELGKRVWRFHGGLKLRHWKQIALQAPPVFAGVPPSLTVPLVHRHQHSEPVVAVGESVVRGQCIAEASGHSPRIHAPWSGIVQSVGNGDVIGYQTPQPVITIETDEGNTDAMVLEPLDWESAPVDVLLQRCHDTGIVGLGGALFATDRKLGGPQKIELLVINGAECEPYIACDESLMRSDPERVVLGSAIAARLCDATTTVIAIEDQMGAVQTGLSRAVENTGVEVFKVPTIYPEGGERQLIEVLTGEQVPSGGLPQDLGIVCLNVATVAALADAIVEGKPLTSRTVTVTGHGVTHPLNVHALIGTPARFLIETAGGYTQNVRRVVMGGPMMGVPLSDDRLCISSATNCLLALIDDDIRRQAPEMPCIRCMECVRVCPAQLMPQLLFTAISDNDWDSAEELSLSDCIECGCCAYACPSQIPLVDYYRHGKSALRLRELEHGKAKQARLRHEARDLRLAREAHQAQRELENKESVSKSDAIRAAVERARKKKRDSDEA